MATTYEAIGTANLAGVADATFSSLGSYTDLVVVGANLTRGTANSVFMRFNGDTTSQYSWTLLVGNGTTASSSRSSYTGVAIANATTGLSTTPTMFTTQVMNYSNSTTFKTILSRDTDSNGATEAIVGLWRKTPEPITSLTVFTGGAFITGTVTIYGILAA
jgi:hypothetical protein